MSSTGINRLLITGFDPFGGESVNPASEVVLELDGEEINGCEIIAKEIPTVYGKSAEVVKEMIDEVEPDVVLHIGQASGTHGIRVERFAVNINDARIEDNEGNQPIDEVIVEDGPAAYWTTIPTRKIVEAVKDAGIPSFLSYTAGTFVCNHVIYSTANYVEENNLPIHYGFIHVPFLPEQAVDKDNQPPSMAKETIKEALIVAIETITE
ncbi:MAG: pyroglutamyl-peptidase I [Thermoplasmata archaeon]